MINDIDDLKDETGKRLVEGVSLPPDLSEAQQLKAPRSSHQHPSGGLNRIMPTPVAALNESGSRGRREQI
ncbi:hypothetical protein, partial [Deinococcus sp.]|uniref:hypothetical protein n=1 Tax=Deinococcus sp. TaxID=47478 RepID=UPI00286983A8